MSLPSTGPAQDKSRFGLIRMKPEWWGHHHLETPCGQRQALHRVHSNLTRTPPSGLRIKNWGQSSSEPACLDPKFTRVPLNTHLLPAVLLHMVPKRGYFQDSEGMDCPTAQVGTFKQLFPCANYGYSLSQALLINEGKKLTGS